MKLADTLSTPKIFAAGAAHVDRRGRPSGSYQPAASSPGTIEATVGGAVFNAALALRAGGADVALVSARGGDPEGEAVAAALRAAGILDCGITWLDRRTPGYMAILDEGGDLVAGIADMALYDLLGARTLSRRHLRDRIARSDALLLDANLPPGGIGHLLDAFGKRPSAAIGVSPAKVMKLRPHLSRLSILFVSLAEAASLVEAPAGTSAAGLARMLRESGAARAVVTDGRSDAAILDGDEILLQAPPAVERVRDVTGAGDTLAAVTSLALLRGASLLGSVRLGMAAAGRRISTDAEPGEDAAALTRIADDMPPPHPADAP